VWKTSNISTNIFTFILCLFIPGTKSSKPRWTKPIKDNGQDQKHEHCNDESSQRGPSTDKGHDNQNEHGGKDKGNSLYLYEVMEAMMLPHVNQLVTAFDLRSYKTAVDIGGQCQCIRTPSINPPNAFAHR
jgi:hypothetical protein